MKIKTILVSCVAALGLVACASSSIDNTNLSVTELNGTTYVNMAEEPAYMNFTEGILSASVGGNVINSNYKEGKDGSLTFSMGLSTKMFVPEELREDEFVDAINSIASYKVDGNVFSFLNKDGNVVIKAQK